MLVLISPRKMMRVATEEGTYQDTQSRQVEGRSDSGNQQITWDFENDIRDEKDEEDDRILFRCEVEISLETTGFGITNIGSVEV